MIVEKATIEMFYFLLTWDLTNPSYDKHYELIVSCLPPLPSPPLLSHVGSPPSNPAWRRKRQ